ncbi:MAG: hypothetical protein A4E39_00014 [Methanoregulaceae archaeon PtaB.Bin152]|nr:MAG: hypothetical protein A4E39_00014 [Methanoregulaceae archaeon PtaB.Bin152]
MSFPVVLAGPVMEATTPIFISEGPVVAGVCVQPAPRSSAIRSKPSIV